MHVKSGGDDTVAWFSFVKVATRNTTKIKNDSSFSTIMFDTTNTKSKKYTDGDKQIL